MFRSIAILAGVMLFASNANAIEVGVGVKAGTLGIGAELTVGLTKTINARVSLTSIDVADRNETISVGDSTASGDLDATLGLDFGATALLVDWHVFDGTFHLTAGMVRNDTKLSFQGALLNGITVDGQALDPDDINGNITGDISLGESFNLILALVGVVKRATAAD